MSQTTAAHHQAAPQQVLCGVVTVSDTRTPATDRGGNLVADLLVRAGHAIVERQIVPDQPGKIRAAIGVLQDRCQAILMTGGTGISPRDETFETVTSLITKSLPGYGELFRQLSFEEIGPAAMLSRATGGLVGSTVLLTMPGSPAAVRLAM
ncbi:MAG: molybdenum cofactor biosynthesis protein B, partial [Pirellulales bacterium]